MFPEDVTIPIGLFDLLPILFGANTPLQIRDWLTALVEMSLVEGSFAAGFRLHDEVRKYAILQCKDLLERDASILRRGDP